MKIEVFKAEKARAYKEFLSQLPVKLDAFYHPEYLTANADYTDSSWEVFCSTSDSDFFVYPYLVKTIYIRDFEIRDITSAYGYSGPACSSEHLGKKTEIAFLEYCKHQEFVSEFVRYHYDSHLTYMFRIGSEILLNRKLVILNLTQEWQTIWQQQFSKTNRNLVRKGINNGFRLATTPEITVKQFGRLYNEHMKSKRTGNFYYFDERYFDDLLFAKDRAYQGQLFGIVKDKELFSAAMFLKSGPYTTYFLSARNLAHSNSSNMNLLLSKSIQFFCENENGVRFLNLGGGVSVSPDDSLLKFKKVFGGDLIKFFIGKRIFDKEKYHLIQKIWLEQHGQEEEHRVKSILQFYHQHVPRGYFG